jgi:hypothetical protein
MTGKNNKTCRCEEFRAERRDSDFLSRSRSADEATPSRHVILSVAKDLEQRARLFVAKNAPSHRPGVLRESDMITLGFLGIIPPPHTPLCNNTAARRKWRVSVVAITGRKHRFPVAMMKNF